MEQFRTARKYVYTEPAASRSARDVLLDLYSNRAVSRRWSASRCNPTANMEAIMYELQELSDSNLREAIRRPASPPLVVVFGKANDSVCRAVEDALKDALKDLAEDAPKDLAEDELEYKFRLGRMETDGATSQQTVRELGILSVPNVVVFKGTLDARTGCVGPWQAEDGRTTMEKQVAKTIGTFLRRALGLAD